MHLEATKEDSTFWYRGTVLDRNLVVVPLANIVTLTLVNLYDAGSCDPANPGALTLVNGRSDIDLIVAGVIQAPTGGLVVNYYTPGNHALVPPTQVFEVEFSAADAPILDDSLPAYEFELHVATFKMVYANGQHVWDVGFNVENLKGH